MIFKNLEIPIRIIPIDRYSFKYHVSADIFGANEICHGLNSQFWVKMSILIHTWGFYNEI